MTVRCGGRCGRPGCAFEGKNENVVNGHVGAVKSRSKGGSPPSGPAPRKDAGAARPFYEPLRDLPWGQQPAAGGAAPTSSQVSAPPPGPLFDSTPWWLNLGKLIDETLLADKKVKVNMTPETAKRLDASLQAAGWRVEANPTPISMPFWLPLAITLIGAFALPIAAAYIPDLIKKARERAAKAKEAAAEKAAAAKVETPGLKPQAPPPPVPGTEVEEERPRIRAAPPPFNFNPMPWHGPGED